MVTSKAAHSLTIAILEVLFVGELVITQTVMVEDVDFFVHHLHIITAQAEEMFLAQTVSILLQLVNRRQMGEFICLRRNK